MRRALPVISLPPHSSSINTINIENKNGEIKPGWVQICKNNETGQLETTYGRKNDTKYDTNDDINYQMSHIVDNMINNWSRYIEQYDEIHGEFAFDELFTPEIPYDYTLENEDDSDSEEDDELYH